MVNDSAENPPQQTLEARCAALIAYDLRIASQSYELPSQVILNIKAGLPFKDKELRNELSGSLKSINLKLIAGPNESDSIRLSLEKATIDPHHLALLIFVRWGTRAGYQVKVDDMDGKLSRVVTGRF